MRFEDQLESAYRSLEPRAAIKNLIGNRMRLVTPEELRSKKKPNLPKQASSSDPWLVSDPCSEGRSLQQTQEEPSSDATIELIPGFFECEDGSEPAIVPQILRDVRGLCMLPFDQAAALSSMKTTISAGECAAVVLGTVQASLGSFPMEAITFPALHCDSGKILLKGVLINYGSKKITLRKSTNEFQLQPKSVQVLTFEIPKEFVSNWDLVLENPLKFIWRNVDKAQAKLLSTWSRKFFHNRVVVPPTSATSFHCFAKALKDDVLPLLAQSGYEGVFVTPKAPDGGAAGTYRIVWLETNHKATLPGRLLMLWAWCEAGPIWASGSWRTITPPPVKLWSLVGSTP